MKPRDGDSYASTIYIFRWCTREDYSETLCANRSRYNFLKNLCAASRRLGCNHWWSHGDKAYKWWLVNFNAWCDGWVRQAYLVLTPIAWAPIMRTLSSGATGEEVATLQAHLSKLGFYKEEITGYFDRLTRAAVADLQTANSLTVVGSVGPKTRLLLQKLMGQ